MNRYLFTLLLSASIFLQTLCAKKENGYKDKCEIIYVPYGHYSPYQDFFPVLTEVTYSCDPGYTLVGSATVQCKPEGWNHKPPECRSDTSTATCERPLTELENGKIEQPDLDRLLNPGEKIWFSCNPNYELIGAAHITCLDDGQWDYNPPKCKPGYLPCAFRDAPQFGSQSPVQKSYEFGDKVFYSCDDGYLLTGAKVAICTRHGKWTARVPVCKPRTCRNLVRPDNGNFAPNLLKFIIGTKVNFRCLPNYRLVGASRLICKKNGEWSDDEPQCQRVGCQPVEAPDNGELSPETDIYDVGDKIFFRCDPNFVLVGTDHATCLRSERFSNPIPSCRPIQCKRPTINNGRIDSDEDLFNVNEEVTFICDKGFKLNGVKTIHCGSNGQWSDPFPRCSRIHCKQPIFEYGSIVPDKEYYDLGESLKFLCDPGYVLEGVSNPVVCVKHNVWSGEFPTCVAVRCPREPFEDGTITEDKEYYYVDEEIYFACDPGFTLSGASHLFCQQDGTWSNDFPECNANQCSRPTLENGRFEDDKQLYDAGETVDFYCDEGFNLVGAQRITCQATSEWSDDFPSCDPVTCPRPTFNGELTADKQHYYVNEVVLFACSDGYVLVGVSKAICLSSGDFSEDIPECVAITCKAPVIANADLDPSSSIYGYEASVLVQCRSGFRIEGESFLECIGVNQWSSEFPNCVAIQCQRPDFNGRLKEDKDFYEVHEIVRFFCLEGSVLKGNDKLTCLANGQFSGNTPFCKKLSCDTPFIDNGDFREKQAKYFSGSVVEFYCDENFMLHGESSITCQVDGSWDFDFPTCREYTCSQPSIDNGRFDPVQESYVLDSTVNFYCEEGYSLDGVQQITCLRKGKWSSGFPTCTPNTCEEPFIENGSFEEVRDVYVVNDEVEFSCDEGYSLVGDETLVCESNGQWSANFPTCAAVLCDKLDLNDGVSVHPNQNTYSVGQVITFRCYRGSTLVGDEDSECLSSGEFSNDSPVCQENMCRQPSIKYGSFDPVQTSYDVNDKVTFSCDDGFRLEGANMISCRSDGSWSAKFPTCEPVTCKVPSIVGGSFNPVQEVYYYRDQVTFSCNGGFSLDGARKIRCLGNGRWSDSFPRCTGNQCGRPVRNPNIIRISPSRSSYDVGVTVTFTCRRGFGLVGSKKSVCQDDGSWSPAEPTCEREVFCKIRTRPRYTIIQPRRYKYAVGQTVTVTCRPGYKLNGDSEITCRPNGKFSPNFPTCSRPPRRCRRPFISSKTIISPDKKYYDSGDEVTFSCIKFYQIGNSQPNSATCGNGRWSESVPSCKFQSDTCEDRCAGPNGRGSCQCHSLCKYAFGKNCCPDYNDYCGRS